MHCLHHRRPAEDRLVDGILRVVGFARAGVGVRGGAAFLLVLDERAGDDAVDGGGPGEGDEGPGEFAHEADGAAAVDEGAVLGVEDVREGAGGGEVRGGSAGGGTAAGFKVSMLFLRECQDIKEWVGEVSGVGGYSQNADYGTGR